MQTVKAIAALIATSGTGYVVGRLVDILGDKFQTDPSKPLPRALLQFSLGAIMLSESIQGLAGVDALSSAPISDSGMMIFFYQAQPGMWAALAELEAKIIAEFSSN